MGCWSQKKKILTFDSLRYMHLACVDTLDGILYVLKCKHRCSQAVAYIPVECGAKPPPQLLKNFFFLIFVDSLGHSMSLFQQSL